MLNISNCSLGIELGSTRIKAVLINEKAQVIASGSHTWENRFENGFWTYSEEDIKDGIRACYSALRKNVFEKYKTEITSLKSIGVSAMMHGYLALGEDNEILTPFRTWRNTTTARASEILSDEFGVKIPLRWSISHLFEAVLNREEHLESIKKFTTLSGYIHLLLTGEHCLGLCDASGMFPVKDNDYDDDLISKVNDLIKKEGYLFNVRSLLPKVLNAGTVAGTLSEEGALFLDITGSLKAGIPLCPPEGDAGTGLVAVNATKAGEGSVSAGTSAFAMMILPESPKNCPRYIDSLVTPDGFNLSMIHANNCSAELDSFVSLFKEFSALSGNKLTLDEIYELLYKNTLNSDKKAGEITAYNFLSAEPVAGAINPYPTYFRTANSKVNLANFFKAELYGSVAALALRVREFLSLTGVSISEFKGHGGIFKVKGVAGQIYADAFCSPLSVMLTAGEGGAFGIALLSRFITAKEDNLSDWLEKEVFSDYQKHIYEPCEEGMKDFADWSGKYQENLKWFN